MTATATKTAHTPGKLADRKGELYDGFAAGKTNPVLAEEFGAHISTIIYHRKKWEEAGKPGAEPMAAPVIQQPPDGDLPPPPPVSCRSVRRQQNLRRPSPNRRPPPVDPLAQDPDNPPATKEQLEQLKAVMAGKVPKPDPQPSAPVRSAPPAVKKPESDQLQWKIEKGRIYEGSIARVEFNFVLVDLIELADSKGRAPRGKVNMAATGLPPMIRDLRDAKQFGLREGALVNAQVIDVRPDPHRPGRQLITLDLDQAPGHPHGYTPPSHLPKQPAKPEPKAAETMTVSDANVLLKAKDEILRLQEQVKATEADRRQLEADLQAAMAVIEQGSAPAQFSLCDTCLKADVCHLALNYQDKIEPAPDDKPDRLATVEIAYGPRPVFKCSAHVKAG